MISHDCNLRIFIQGLCFSLVIAASRPDAGLGVLYVLGLPTQQSFLRSTQTKNIAIRQETLDCSNVCPEVLLPTLPSPSRLGPPQTPSGPLGPIREQEHPARCSSLHGRQQEICFTRLVLTQLPAVRRVAAVCEMNDGRGKSVISFVQTDYSHVAHGIICLSLND